MFKAVSGHAGGVHSRSKSRIKSEPSVVRVVRLSAAIAGVSSGAMLGRGTKSKGRVEGGAETNAALAGNKVRYTHAGVVTRTELCILSK